MAKTTGNVSVADMIREGLLRSGERIVLVRRSAPAIEATVEADGTIKAGKQTFKSPSGAAKQLLDVGSVDGWIRWRVPRLNNRTLDDLRNV